MERSASPTSRPRSRPRASWRHKRCRSWLSRARARANGLACGKCLMPACRVAMKCARVDRSWLLARRPYSTETGPPVRARGVERGDRTHIYELYNG